MEQTRDALRLTYERDALGLVFMLVIDMAIGAVYGVVIGLLLSVLSKAGLDRKSPTPPRPLPAPEPLRRTFRT